MKTEKILCPYCSKEFTDEMIEIYNGSYGCPSGCDYYSVRIYCTSCKKLVYQKGDFGYFETETEKKEYIEKTLNIIRKEGLKVLTGK